MLTSLRIPDFVFAAVARGGASPYCAYADAGPRSTSAVTVVAQAFRPATRTRVDTRVRQG
jgi:hypothetical protein